MFGIEKEIERAKMSLNDAGGGETPPPSLEHQTTIETLSLSLSSDGRRKTYWCTYSQLVASTKPRCCVPSRILQRYHHSLSILCLCLPKWEQLCHKWFKDHEQGGNEHKQPHQTTASQWWSAWSSTSPVMILWSEWVPDTWILSRLSRCYRLCNVLWWCRWETATSMRMCCRNRAYLSTPPRLLSRHVVSPCCWNQSLHCSAMDATWVWLCAGVDTPEAVLSF